MTDSREEAAQRLALRYPVMCPRCQQEYKAGLPENFASAPECAFVSGVFSNSNWNCATANALRDTARQDEDDSFTRYNDDENAALIPWPESGAYVVLAWYKHRGRTDGAWVVRSNEMTHMTITEAEEFLGALSP